MLSAEEVVNNREKPFPELPSLGIKDFEPNGSQEELCQIEHSLFEIESGISYKRMKSLNHLSQAVWRPELNLAEITHQTGSFWSYMGHKIGNQLYIYPEEALYLLEKGALEITYNGVSMSVQRAYFILNDSNVRNEKYRVYSLLSSHGFKVLRHSPQNTVTKYEKKIEIHRLGIKLKNYSSSVHKGKRPVDSDEQYLKINKKPKVSPTNVTLPYASNALDDNATFLKRLPVVQSYTDNTETILNFEYDIYSDMRDKCSFKKSCLQLPKYRVIIHRGEDPMPEVSELYKLTNKYKDEVPVIHAVVFCDFIAFYRIDSVILPNLNE